jgi:hypothetical protein
MLGLKIFWNRFGGLEPAAFGVTGRRSVERRIVDDEVRPSPL